MHLKPSQLVFLLLLTALVDTKRSKGRSGAIGLWSRKGKGSSGLKVRRNKVPEAPEPKQPLIKDTDVVHKPLESNINNSSLKKIRQPSKFKQKRHVNPVNNNIPYPYNAGIFLLDRRSDNSSGSNGYDDNHVYERTKRSGGFFGKQIIKNMSDGVFVWYLVSGSVSRPYKVYNFNNQSTEERTEIILPGNVLMNCDENATNMCVPDTTAICTQDEKILCVTAMTTVSSSSDNSKEMSVNCIMSYVDNVKNPLCQNKTRGSNATTCLTTMTLEYGQSYLGSNITLPKSENSKFCVARMAIPDPDLPIEEVKSIEDSKNAIDDNNLQSVGYYEQNNMVEVTNH